MENNNQTMQIDKVLPIAHNFEPSARGRVTSKKAVKMSLFTFCELKFDQAW